MKKHELETCETCCGAGRLADAAAPWWRWWASIACPTCGGQGYMQRSICGRYTRPAILSAAELNLVTLPREQYERLLKLESRLALLESLLKKRNVWGRLREQHVRLRRIEYSVAKLERINKPLPLFQE